MRSPLDNQKKALRFIFLLGIVSLFADVTYEGARSINGSFLSILGASGAAVGLASGAGELVGYCLRLVSGILSDKTKKYWTITLVGYCVNMLAVPCLALAGHWSVAAGLMIAERLGKAIRTPARDVMISQASSEMGRGWGFAVHEALDQVGAMSGPLLVTAVLWFRGSYRECYAVLLIPAILAILTLLFARFLYPRPHELETKKDQASPEGFSKRFWIYLLAISLVAAGTADFPLIAFHFERSQTVPRIFVPIFYSIAMGVDAISALIFGKWFDRKGLSVLMTVAFLSVFTSPLVFGGGIWQAGIGMMLWGVGMGVQESVMRAAISGMLRPGQRGTGFGWWNMAYGLSWFLGSAALGFLYDKSILLVIIFSMSCFVVSIPFFWWVSRRSAI